MQSVGTSEFNLENLCNRLQGLSDEELKSNNPNMEGPDLEALCRLRPDDGQAGSYRFVRRISTDKRACVYEYRVNSRVVGKPEVIQ